MGIVDRRRDSSQLQLALQRIALFGPDGVQAIDMANAGQANWTHYSGAFQQPVVFGGQLASDFRPTLQVRKLGAQNGGLESRMR